MNKKTFYIEKVLNNNSILIEDEHNNAAILLGKGIGFNRKSDAFSEINPELIEKSFYNFDETLKNQLIDMIKTFDEDIIQVSKSIIELAESVFGALNSHVYVSLTDHISFALDRLKNDLQITNPFQSQIKILLPKEYQIGLKAREIIQEKFNILIPDEEVSFIAFHINAAREQIKVNRVVQEMRIYKDITQMIQDDLDIALDSDTCSDLYLIIQAYVKKETLPLQFLIERIPLTEQNLDANHRSVIGKITSYIENQIGSKLSVNQKSVLSAYIEHVRAKGVSNA